MANQMIALGVRGPQIPDLGAAMSRQANMMANMAVARERQGVAQRAAAFRELVGSEGFDPSNPAHIRAASALDPAGAADIAQSYDRRRAAQQTFDVAEMARLRNLGTSVVDEPSYQAWLGEVDKADPRSAAMFRQASPNYNPDFMNRVIMEAEQFINKSIATPTASVQYGEGGGAYGVTVGGLGRPTAEEVTVVQPGMQAPVGGPAPIAAPAPAQPMSATQPGLTAQEAAPILRRAAQSQTISPEDANRVRQSLGPDGQARFEQWMTNNNIVVQQPSGQIITPTTRVRQGAYGGAAPMSAQYSAASSQQPVNQPGTQFRGRDPSMGQYPGSAQVPIERVRQEAEAGRPSPAEAGAVAAAERETPQQVEARLAAQGRQERRNTLEANFAAARSAASAIIQDANRRIDQIDRFLADPRHASIIGSFEGRIPRLLQNEDRSAMQAYWDQIVNNDVLTELLAQRAATETGASPMGIVSDRDMQVAASAANALSQTTGLSDMTAEMRRLRAELETLRDNQVNLFNDTYRDIFGDRYAPLRGRTSAQPRTTKTGARVSGAWPDGGR